MKKNIATLIGIGIIAFATIPSAPPALALDQIEPNGPITKEQTVAERRAQLTERLNQLKTERQARLSERKLQACQAKTEKINAIIQQRGKQAEKHLETFKSIATRVQEFVQTKQRTVENYDTLVAAIEEKEAAAQAAIEVNNATVFDCTTADASSPAKVPRTTITEVRDTLKEYRTAIKNLIVQVKNTGGNEGSEQ